MPGIAYDTWEIGPTSTPMSPPKEMAGGFSETILANTRTISITETLAKQDIDPHFTADQVMVYDHDFGYVFGRSKEIITPRGGGPVSIAYSRELWQFRRTELSWKISHLIYNIKPPPSE